MCRYLPHTSSVWVWFFFLFFSRQVVWRSGSLHRSTLSCLSTMQQYFCGGGVLASRSSCAVIVTEDSSLIVLVQQKRSQLRSSAAPGSVGGFHLGRHNPRHVFLLCTAPHFPYRQRTALEKSLFRCSNLPAFLLLTFCFQLFWQSTETRSIKVNRKPEFLTPT